MEDIKELVEKYEKLSQEYKEFKKVYKDITDEVINNMVIITQKDREYCEMIIETETETETEKETEKEIAIRLMERIPEIKKIIEKYKVKRKEVYDIAYKIENTETKLVMILRQITGIDFNRCRSLFEEDEELVIKIMKYIDKIEGEVK